MPGWTDGDLAAEFERRLDDLLADVSPGWQPAELPERCRSDRGFRDYYRTGAKRTHVGDVLKGRPDLAAFHAGRILAAIVCDEHVAANRELIYPVMQAVGRRAVQRYLISAVENEPEHKKACAVRAWYWSQVSLVFDSVDALRRRQPTPASRAADDEVVDLRGDYRNACLAAFVASDYGPTREWLGRGFLLVEDYYPPNLRPLVSRARAIAETEPERYEDLLAKAYDEPIWRKLGSPAPERVGMRQALAGHGIRSRMSTAVPGVEKAPNPVVTRECGTWKPRRGPSAGDSGR